MLGFGATLSFWWLLDAEYGRPEFQPLRDAASLALPWVPPLTFLGVLLSAWRLGPAREVATPLADFMLSLGALKSTEALRQRLLALLVRAIFLPLNFCALAQGLAYFRSREAHLFSSAWPHTHAELLLLIYTVMIATIVPGYLFSSRLLATQVRQVDATASGWAATLLCYRPLSVVVFERWLNYRGASALPGVERTWSTVAEGWPALMVAIGTALVLLEIVHLWAEASFGLRASNLSHRGIITHGPYRWCKHPIYLSKCLGWLLLYLPFAMSTSMQSLRATILFGGVCILYAMRAHTEERLLASDPDYVAYALWMDRHGLFAGVGRLLPIIKFCHRFEKWQRP